MLDDRIHSLEAGMNGYLTKPLNQQKLAALLEWVASDPERSVKSLSPAE